MNSISCCKTHEPCTGKLELRCFLDEINQLWASRVYLFSSESVQQFLSIASAFVIILNHRMVLCPFSIQLLSERVIQKMWHFTSIRKCWKSVQLFSWSFHKVPISYLGTSQVPTPDIVYHLTVPTFLTKKAMKNSFLPQLGLTIRSWPQVRELVISRRTQRLAYTKADHRSRVLELGGFERLAGPIEVQICLVLSLPTLLYHRSCSSVIQPNVLMTRVLSLRKNISRFADRVKHV